LSSFAWLHFCRRGKLGDSLISFGLGGGKHFARRVAFDFKVCDAFGKFKK
jgi:hypothetical protein